jgi:hypothetical protein
MVVSRFVDVKKAMNSNEAAQLVAMIRRNVDAHEGGMERVGQKRFMREHFSRWLAYYA